MRLYCRVVFYTNFDSNFYVLGPMGLTLAIVSNEAGLNKNGEKKQIFDQ